MKSSFKKLPQSRIELKVSLDEKEFKKYWDIAYDRALGAVEIKGFRKGSAPKEMADAYIDKDKTFQEAVQSAARETLGDYVEREGWVIVDQPKVEALDAKKGLEYKAEFTIFPEVKLPDCKKIAKDVVQGRKPVEVTDEEVQKSIEWLRDSRAKLTRVARAAQNGDVIEIDFETKVGGVPIEGGTAKKDRFILGKAQFIPGFEDNIIGKKEGEKFSFTLTAPADYWNKNLQGKTIDFSLILHSIFERELAPLDDAFAKGIGAFENLAAFQTSVRAGLLEEKKNEEERIRRMQILAELIKSSEADIPEIFIERTLEQFARGKKLENAELEKARERARNNVLGNLIIYQIAKNENLTPTKEEVGEEAQDHGGERGSVDENKFTGYIYDIVQQRKVFNFLES